MDRSRSALSRLVAALLGLALVVGCSHAGGSNDRAEQPPASSPAPVRAWLDALVPWGFRGAVAVLEDGEPIVAAGFGTVEPGPDSEPVDLDTRFGIGSNTKPLTAQRRFVQDASHELRNPLAVMRTTLDVALEDPTTATATWRKVGGGVRDNIDRMTGVVDSLLRTAREDTSAPTTSEFDPATVLHRVAAQVEGAAVHDDITAVVAADAGCISGDLAAVERAVANLVDNALRHAPPGSTVALRGSASDGLYDIRVHDGGPGIPPDAVDAVFERGHRSPTSPGLGLGLAIARDIVEAHRGQISLESTGPGGTTFRISLPTS